MKRHVEWEWEYACVDAVLQRVPEFRDCREAS